MIRLIKRKLIIPQGDTGTFTIPTQGTVEEGDKAIFSVYDPLTQETVLQKEIDATNETLSFTFTPDDTKDIEPRGDYVWDITLIRSDSVDSYYAAFKLPPCEIRRVTRAIYE